MYATYLIKILNTILCHLINKKMVIFCYICIIALIHSRYYYCKNSSQDHEACY